MMAALSWPTPTQRTAEKKNGAPDRNGGKCVGIKICHVFMKSCRPWPCSALDTEGPTQPKTNSRMIKLSAPGFPLALLDFRRQGLILIQTTGSVISSGIWTGISVMLKQKRNAVDWFKFKFNPTNFQQLIIFSKTPFKCFQLTLQNRCDDFQCYAENNRLSLLEMNCKLLIPSISISDLRTNTITTFATPSLKKRR